MEAVRHRYICYYSSFLCWKQNFPHRKEALCSKANSSQYPVWSRKSDFSAFLIHECGYHWMYWHRYFGIMVSYVYLCLGTDREKTRRSPFLRQILRYKLGFFISSTCWNICKIILRQSICIRLYMRSLWFTFVEQRAHAEFVVWVRGPWYIYCSLNLPYVHVHSSEAVRVVVLQEINSKMSVLKLRFGSIQNPWYSTYNLESKKQPHPYYWH